MSVILAIASLVLILSVSWLRTRIKNGRVPSQLQPVTMRPPILPGGVFLGANHAWLHLRTDGTLRIGIDDLLAGAVGRIDSVDLPLTGQEVQRGDPLFMLLAGGRHLTVRAPASGMVTTTNLQLQEAPWLAEKDPYGQGWVAVLRCCDPRAEILPLRLGSEGQIFLIAELARLADLLRGAAHGTGGDPNQTENELPEEGALRQLDNEAWGTFQQCFLDAADGFSDK